MTVIIWTTGIVCAYAGYLIGRAGRCKGSLIADSDREMSIVVGVPGGEFVVNPNERDEMSRTPTFILDAASRFVGEQIAAAGDLKASVDLELWRRNL